MDHFGKRPPVYAPYTTPVYSNTGSVLVGLVAEAVTKKAFPDLVKSSIFDPTGMTRSAVRHSPELDDKGFIPDGDSGYLAWKTGLGCFEPQVFPSPRVCDVRAN